MSASAVLKLQKVGFSTEQVEALADFMDTQAASKADLSEAKGELKDEFRSENAKVRAEIAMVKADLSAAIGDLKDEFRSENAKVRAEIADIKADITLLEHRMTIKLGGMLVVIAGIVLAAVRFLPHP